MNLLYVDIGINIQGLVMFFFRAVLEYAMHYTFFSINVKALPLFQSELAFRS